MVNLRIQIDDLQGDEIAAFLSDHIQDMRSVSPPESKHALDLESLRARDITFWSVYHEQVLVGCGALKELSNTQGELKSMRTSPSMRGTGIGKYILSHVVSEAQRRGYLHIYLETGSMPFFIPARKLYESFGFTTCAPFANYKEDPQQCVLSV